MLFSVAVGLISVVLSFILVKRYLFKIFQEIFVVYHVMRGGEGHYRQNEVSNLKIYPFVMKTEFMDEALLVDVCHHSSEYYSNLSLEYARKAILKHNYIVLLRDRISGVLRGTCLFTFKKEKDYTLFVLGGMNIDRMYRGEMYFYLAPAYYVIRELIRHPFTPIYSVGKGLSYKSYMGAVKTFGSQLYPRYDMKTPEHLQNILNTYGESIAGFNEVFNHETGVIERDAIAFKDHVAGITDTDRKNPHIKFYEERNPGWIKGNCLVLITPLDWWASLGVIRRGISKGSRRTTSSFAAERNHSASKSIYIATKSFVHKETDSDLLARVDIDLDN